jgi:aminoglycoside phosphotransferase
MILEILELIRDLAPDLFDMQSELSAICIRTTQPKYLIFDKDPQKPTCIVQLGEKEDLERLHGILARLHSKTPELIARPLALSMHREDKYIHIQEGLPGWPWFRASEAYKTQKEWRRLALMTYKALSRFHEAVSTFSDWMRTISPGQELRKQAKICREGGTPLTKTTESRIVEASEALDDLGEMECVWQHGDFCLNNVLISGSRVSIIDFDEFGGTVMPLHDEIGLDLSLQDLASSKNFGSLNEIIDSFKSYRGRIIAAEHFSGLYLHYILWRINQCRDYPTRAQVKQALLAKLEISTPAF